MTEIRVHGKGEEIQTTGWFIPITDSIHRNCNKRAYL